MIHDQFLNRDAAQQDDAPVQAIARLRGVIALIEGLDGSHHDRATPLTLDEAARLADAYAHGPSVARRRFDALAGETSAFAAAGVALLMRAQERTGRARAAARLASEIRAAIAGMTATLAAA